MSEVFLSYAHKDRASAERIAHALETRGWSVFWDRNLQTGQAYDQVLYDALRQASCVIVLWSEHSAISDWVRDEAEHGKQRGVLVPIQIDEVRIPLGFGRIHTSDFSAWSGEPDDPVMVELDRALRRTMIGSRPAPQATPSGAPTVAPPAHKSVVELVKTRPLLWLTVPLIVVGLIGIVLLWSRSGGDDSVVGLETTGGSETTVDNAPVDSTTTSAGTIELASTDSPSGEPLLPSAAGMAHVVIAEPVIGFADYAAVTDPERFRPERALGSSVDFYVDEGSTTNAFYREWLIYTAGTDLAMWADLAPLGWGDNTDGEYPTYPEGKGGEPLTGVGFDSAQDYCTYVNKRPVTEIEWELAAGAEAFRPTTTEIQNWVASPEDYGPVAPGNLVLRGNFGTEDQVLQYRTIGPDSSVFRTYAGIRCASNTVRPESTVASAGSVSYSDDFSDLETGWPSTVPNGTFSVGYHPTDVYHVETERANVQTLVLAPEDAPLDSTVATEVELRKPDDRFGEFRYGLLLRASAQGYLVFTVAPEIEEGARYVAWCLSQVDEPALDRGEQSGSQTTDSGVDRCAGGLAQGRLGVETFNNRLSVSLTGSAASATIDGNEVLGAGVSVGLPAGGTGFYLESFDENRFVHVHYDGLLYASR